MRPIITLITTDPEIIRLSTYARVGAGIAISGAATVAAIANKDDVTTLITGAVTANSILTCPADALLVTGGIGQTVTVLQNGD